jgi:hypothetical protein
MQKGLLAFDEEEYYLAMKKFSKAGQMVEPE